MSYTCRLYFLKNVCILVVASVYDFACRFYTIYAIVTVPPILNKNVLSSIFLNEAAIVTAVDVGVMLLPVPPILSNNVVIFFG